jgi:non-ribosomal peptide synthetase component F
MVQDRTMTSRPALSPFATPGEALAAQAAARGDQDGLVFPMSDGRLRFAEWDQAATALARTLSGLGLVPGRLRRFAAFSARLTSPRSRNSPSSRLARTAQGVLVTGGV